MFTSSKKTEKSTENTDFLSSLKDTTGVMSGSGFNIMQSKGLNNTQTQTGFLGKDTS